jgi:purine-binding chemotaxis protein CheW
MTDAAPNRAASAEPGARPEILVFQLDEAQFGLLVTSVREVVRVPPITRLPFPPPSIAGVVGLRGTVLPVVDLGDLLLGQPARRDGRLVIVTEETTRSPVALLVDRVIDLVFADRDADLPPPEIAESLPAGSIDGVISPAPDRTVSLLNLDHVLGRLGRGDEESR